MGHVKVRNQNATMTPPSRMTKKGRTLPGRGRRRRQAYRPLDVRTEVLPLARALVDDRIPPGTTTADRVEYTHLVAGTTNP